MNILSSILAPALAVGIMGIISYLVINNINITNKKMKIIANGLMLFGIILILIDIRFFWNGFLEYSSKAIIFLNLTGGKNVDPYISEVKSIFGSIWYLPILITLWGYCIKSIKELLDPIEINSEDYGYYTRNRSMDKVNDINDEDNVNESEIVKIRRRLNDDLNKLEKNIEDPAVVAKRDAIGSISGDGDENNVLPEQNDTVPAQNNYEFILKEKYKNLGVFFLSEILQELIKSIRDYQHKISVIHERIQGRKYEDFARDKAGDLQNNSQIQISEILRIRDRYHKANIKLKAFIKSLRLHSHENPDWENKRTTNLGLLLWGGSYVMAEFLFSFLVLEPEIGRTVALGIAAVSVTIITLLGTTSGLMPQFFYANSRLHTRIMTALFLVALIAASIIAIGLICGYRTDSNITTSTIVRGYSSIGDDLNMFFLALINIIGYAAIFWKVMLRVNKYHGYDLLKYNYDKYSSKWGRIRRISEENVRKAILEIDYIAESNTLKVEQYINEIRKKSDFLRNLKENFKSIIDSTLNDSYKEIVTTYREVNKEHRTLSAYPAPVYFDNMNIRVATTDEFFNEINNDLINFIHQEDVINNINKSEQRQKYIIKENDRWKEIREKLQDIMLQEQHNKLSNILKNIVDSNSGIGNNKVEETNARDIRVITQHRSPHDATNTTNTETW